MSTSARPEPTEPADAVAGTDPGAASGTDTSTARPGPRRVLVVWTVVLAALVLVLDQLTKWWAESSLTLGDDTIPLLGSLLGLRLIYNPGAALSIATGMTWLLTIVVVAVVVVIVRMVSRIGSRAWAVALGLLLGGALGNLVDRFFREPGFARGHVVDFIAYANWFVGNVADIAIVAAARVRERPRRRDRPASTRSPARPSGTGSERRLTAPPRGPRAPSSGRAR